MSEPVRKGAEPQPLVLDWSEFEGESNKATARPPPGRDSDSFEPPTARYDYITSIEQLKALLRRAVCPGREAAGFDPAAFADRISVVGMCTREREEPHLYYFIEDKLGNQYRLYMDPEGAVSDRKLDLGKKVVLDFGNGRTGYLFPLAFQGEERR